jgi:hypothetical protein
VTARGRRERLGVVGLGFVLALAIAPPPQGAAAPADSRAQRIPTLYSKSRSFRIPFNIDPADRKRLREVQLWASEDQGEHFEPKSRTTIERPYFPFRAAHDGEYWFAVQTTDVSGRVLPDKGDVEPNMKVIVDTTPPSLTLEQDGRRGSLAAVRWEVRDEHLDLKSLVIEYQEEGARNWRQVRIRRPALIGSESWDAGTADALKVRASIEDKAGNRAETVINLDEGMATNPAPAAGDIPQFPTPPPISRISSGPGFPPVDDTPKSEPQDPFPPQEPLDGGVSKDTFGTPPDSFTAANSSAGSQPAPRVTGTPAGGSRTLLVSSPRFSLKYEVDDAGPNGPASVELWVTQDGGRTWNRHNEDSDRVSPFDVDLGTEGTFGLCLVARAVTGLGDQPPAPGDPPQIWVEVDSTPPTVQIAPPQIGVGRHVGKVAIAWRATDLHLAPRPVTLSWRADQPNAAWQPITGPLENTGRYIWTVPANVPPKIHIRVEVADTAGNHASADTVDLGAVIVDRTRPRGRITGLDTGNRAGASAGFRPIQ